MTQILGLRIPQKNSQKDSQKGKPTVYASIVEDLKAFVTRYPAREIQFRQAIYDATNPANGGAEEMKAEGINTLEDYFRYCQDLLHWVPTVTSGNNELLRKLLVFHWVLNQPSVIDLQTPVNPAATNDNPTWLSYWQVSYAREIGRWLSTKESTGGIQSFYDNATFNQEAHLWQDPPAGGWESFNQFFARRWKDVDVARPLSEADQAEDVIVSAADSIFNGNWDVQQGFVTIKGFVWPISKLLQNAAADFASGSFMNAFLTPTDYHRQHAPISGKVVEARVIQEQVYLQLTKMSEGNGKVGLALDRGLLVPQSLRKKGLGKEPQELDGPDEPTHQWCQTRGLIVIENEIYGKVAVLPIGLAHISSVVLHVEVGQDIVKGQEISNFAYGGSDMVLVFQHPVEYTVNKGDKCNVRTRIATFGPPS